MRPAADRFAEFHAANPRVYDELVTLARRAHRAGQRRIGMKLLFEVVRWEHLLSTSGDDEGFKLNNDYTPFYARLIARQEPELQHLFRTRESQADGA